MLRAMADDAIDPDRPKIVLYLSNENGKLKLVGVEYWKADADQSLATSGDRPSLFGHRFEGPMPGHNPRSRCTTTCTCGSPRRTRAAPSRRSTRRSAAGRSPLPRRRSPGGTAADRG